MKKTTAEQRAALAVAGFVRVDGLQTLVSGGSYIIKPLDERLGRFGAMNGFAEIVTEGGEIWLATMNFIPMVDGPVRELLPTLCPNGSISDIWNRWGDKGESLNWREIFYRLANPDWMPGS